LIFWKYSSGRI